MEGILPLLLGGLIIFLYAITRLSEVMKSLFSKRAKSLVEKYTSNIFSALLIGTVMTVLLDSSSAVIILVIVLINARTLTFKQAIGLIMGANIGTTISSQIIAFDVGKYAVIPLFIGLALLVFARGQRWKNAGSVLFYFGLLFFGLFVMETSVEPLHSSAVFEKWIARVEGNEWQGALIGGIITLIIQSSSGTVGMAIVLCKQQLLSVAGGVAIMLGAELGTCSDTLLATINGSTQAIKAGIFHLTFNLVTILLGLGLFEPFLDAVLWISHSEEIGRIVANAHVLFNILGVLIFLPFIHLVLRGMNFLLPENHVHMIH